MLPTFQVTTLLLFSMAMATAVAHALELPGKMRLSQETYVAVQPIYYPGFTVVGGIGEFGGMLATLVLILLTPGGTTTFRLTLAAFIAMVLMHAVFWLFTQPVNRFWLRDQELSRAGSAFFAVRGRKQRPQSSWKSMRNQWEYSHVARAVMSFAAVALLAAAIAAT